MLGLPVTVHPQPCLPTQAGAETLTPSLLSFFPLVLPLGLCMCCSCFLNTSTPPPLRPRQVSFHSPPSPGLGLDTRSVKPPLSCVWPCLPYPRDRWCRVTCVNTCHVDRGASQVETLGSWCSALLCFPNLMKRGLPEAQGPLGGLPGETA